MKPNFPSFFQVESLPLVFTAFLTQPPLPQHSSNKQTNDESRQGMYRGIQVLGTFIVKVPKDVQRWVFFQGGTRRRGTRRPISVNGTVLANRSPVDED